MAITQIGTFNNVHYALRSDCKATFNRGVRMLEGFFTAMNINHIKDLHNGQNITYLKVVMSSVALGGGTPKQLSYGLGDTEADALAKL